MRLARAAMEMLYDRGDLGVHSRVGTKRLFDLTERPEHLIVIGGGQTGLAAGYHLAKRGIDFVILEASRRVGDVWRGRYASLRLYSPARYDRLPGLPPPPVYAEVKF